MRMFKTSLIALACLATAAQTAAAAPQPATFKFVSFGTTLPGLPGLSISPYTGTFNGGVSTFDVYCIDALDNVFPGGTTDFAVYTTRLDGIDALNRTRLGNLTPGNGDDFPAYIVAAYIANNIRLGVYNTGLSLGAAQLAMWYITSGLISFVPPAPGGGQDLAWGIMTSEPQILNQLESTQPGGDPDYPWEGVIADALLNGGNFFTSGQSANWIVITDARWSAERPCFTVNPNNPGQDNQNCIQEVLKYDVVPEPATMGLMAVGLVGLGVAGMRRRNRK
jgi:hypothetical protein